MARPRLKIDPLKVQELASIGCTGQEIAVLLTPCVKTHAGKFIERETIETRFSTQIQRGRAELHESLKRQLCTMALSGNVAACIFALKAYAGLRDGAENAPQTTNLILQVGKTEATKLEAESQPIREVAAELIAKYRPELNGNGNGQHEKDLK
jgi:hypothetical protein